jgi:hypothetical protein
MNMVGTSGKGHQMQVTNLSNLLAKDNPMDLVIQPEHASEGHKNLLIRKKQEWDWWGMEENLLGNQLQQ